MARGRKLIADYRDRYPNAMACLEKSLAECITCLACLDKACKFEAITLEIGGIPVTGKREKNLSPESL